MFTRPSTRALKRGAVVSAALALVGTALATTGPTGTTASSHREAPLIAGDPRADNTDVYAFVSPDDPDTVTLISNWLPFEEPNGGPNFYPWAEDTRYNIKIDNDGDAVPDLTYTWVFTTVIRDDSQFLYNTGPVDELDDPNLNYYQTYDLTLSVEGAADVLLLDDQIAAPSLVGPGSIPDYAPLMAEATVALPGGGQTYAGQADDPFFLDLRVFDLLYGGDLSEVGEDTLAGYNVNTVAIQVPKDALAAAGSSELNPVIGVWSTTDRRAVRNANGTGDDTSEFVQVSRLGNPLVNEVVFPLKLKDAFNSIPPTADATAAAGDGDTALQYVTNPILPGLLNAVYGLPVPGDNNDDGDNDDAGDDPRSDLVEIFLQGVSESNDGLSGDSSVLPVDLNGHDLNAVAAATAVQPSEQLRLNMNVAPSAAPNRLGVFAGQFDAFPNGRRLVDDVIDIALQVVAGADPTTSPVTIVDALAAGDAVDRNDRAFSETFPYLALPHGDSVNNGTERPPRASEFVTVTPDRVLDTRPSAGQVGYIGDKPAGGQEVEVQVTGVGTSLVPEDAKAVAVNITLAENEGPTFVTAYDCDDDASDTSNVNTVDVSGGTSNLAIVGISDAGTICLQSLASAHLIADIGGYIPSSSTVSPVVPERLLETRASEGQIGYAGVKPAAGEIIRIDVTGSDQVADGAIAAFVNVTSTESDAPGFATVWDCNGDAPDSSILNFEPGVVIPNLTVAPLNADGEFCLFTLSSSHLLVDLMGSVPAESTYVRSGPTRILETRASEGQIGYSGDQPAAGETVRVQVTGVAGVPAGTTSAFLNVTTTNESPTGFVTVWPCDEPQPNASSGNYRGVGKSTASLVAANLDASGEVCIFVLEPVDLVVDLVGYFPGLNAG